MPLHARGAHYFGQIGAFLKCTSDHGKQADQIYSEMVTEGVFGTRSFVCSNCQAYVNVTRRANDEWETQEFPTKMSIERE